MLVEEMRAEARREKEREEHEENERRVAEHQGGEAAAAAVVDEKRQKEEHVAMEEVAAADGSKQRGMGKDQQKSKVVSTEEGRLMEKGMPRRSRVAGGDGLQASVHATAPALVQDSKKFVPAGEDALGRRQGPLTLDKRHLWAGTKVTSVAQSAVEGPTVDGVLSGTSSDSPPRMDGKAVAADNGGGLLGWASGKAWDWLTEEDGEDEDKGSGTESGGRSDLSQVVQCCPYASSFRHGATAAQPTALKGALLPSSRWMWRS